MKYLFLEPMFIIPAIVGAGMLLYATEIGYWMADTTPEKHAARIAASPFQYGAEGTTRVMTDVRSGCRYIVGGGLFSVTYTPILTSAGTPDCSGARRR